MNGATAEPWANIINTPSNNIIRIIGANQNFFLAFRKLHSSFKNDIIYSIKIDYSLFLVECFFFQNSFPYFYLIVSSINLS